MALSTTYFDPLFPSFLKSPNFALQIVVFCSKDTLPVIIDAHCAKLFFTQLGYREYPTKTTFRAKINGV